MDQNQRPYKPRATHELDWRGGRIEDAELLDFIQYQYDAAKRRRATWECGAEERLCLVRGNQTVEVFEEEIYDKIIQGGAPRHRSPEDIKYELRDPIEVNTLLGQVTMKIAFLVGRPITWRCRPTMSDDAARRRASVASKLLQWQWQHGQRAQRLQIIRLLFHMYVTGVAFLHPFWDPDAGPVRRVGPDLDGEPADLRAALAAKFAKRAEASGLKVQDGQAMLPQGEAVVRWRTGFDISEPPMTADLDECPWIIDTVYERVETLRATYPEHAADIDPGGCGEAYQAQWQRLYDTTFASENEPGEHVLVHRLWRPRSRECPQGYYAKITEKVVLRKGPHPYRHGQLPFSRIYEIPDGQFRPTCSVAQQMRLQMSRNKIRSKMNAAVDDRLDPTLLCAEHQASAHLMEKTKKIIDVQDVQSIKPLEHPPLPGEIMEIDALYRSDLQELGGIHDSTQGRAESAQQSGRHALVLKQQDETRNSITRQHVEAAYAVAGRQCISLWAQYVRMERAIDLLGPNLEHEIVTFTGADLAGEDELDIECYLGPVPDLAAALDEIQTLTQMGYMSPENPQDRARVARLVGDETTRGEDSESQHYRQAAEENAILARGGNGRVQAVLGDDHALHIREHLLAMARHRNRVLDDHDTKQRFDTHINHHLLLQADQMVRPTAYLTLKQATVPREVQGVAAEFDAEQGRPPIDLAPPVLPASPAGGGNGRMIPGGVV